MKKYIKKYSILLIVLIAIQGLLKTLIVSQLQIILIKIGIEFNEANYIMNTALINIPYLINVIFALVILNDLIKNKIKGIPVVLLTVMSYFAGILFFLFLMNNKINSDDK